MAKTDIPLMPAMVDLSKLFRERLRLLIADCGETADLAGLDGETIARVLLTGLLYEAVRGGVALGLDETEFVRLCFTARRELIKLDARGSGPFPTA